MRSRPFTLQRGDLLSQGKVLQDEVGSRPGEGSDRSNDDGDDSDEESGEGQHGRGILAGGTGDLKRIEMASSA